MEDDTLLSVGTRLGEFEILGLVGVGGFGIVYRAFDHDLEREVAIKEYMPGLLATRVSTGAVQPRSRTHAETFEAGLRSFMMEAKMLARFDHPALVKVFRYWEGNGTAYMVMPLYQGQTLSQVLKQMGSPPGEGWLMGVLVPLLGALEVLHSQQIFHRDVSPDNILLQRNGRPVLLDFGAARQVITDRTQTLTAILKPNYAPIEQYAEVPNLKQGPWTDLYALGAVVCFSLTGKPPPPAAARTLQDDMVPLSTVAEKLAEQHGLRFSPAFLEAWQQALAVRPGERPQSVAALMQKMGLVPTTGAGGVAGSIDPNSTVVLPRGAAPNTGSAAEPATVYPTAGGPGSDDWTVVATGQRFTVHPVSLPTGPEVPSIGLPTQGGATGARMTQGLAGAATGAPRTASTPTGRDMRPVPPGATQSSGPHTGGATVTNIGTVAAADQVTLPPPTGTPSSGAAAAPVQGGTTSRPTGTTGASDHLTPLERQPDNRKGGAMLMGTVVAALALAAGGYFLLRSPSGAQNVAPPVAVASAPVVATSAPEPQGQGASEASVSASAVAQGGALPARSAASRPEPEIITEYPDPPASAVVAAATVATPKPAVPAASKASPAPVIAASKPVAAASKPTAAASKPSGKAGKNNQDTGAGAHHANAPADTLPAAPVAPKAVDKPVAASVPSAPRVEEDKPRSPEEACGKRVFLARHACIYEKCHTPEFFNHGTCVEMRRKEKEDEARRTGG